MLFCVDGDPTDEHAAKMEIQIDEMGTSRSWVIAAPEFVDEVDDSSCTRPEDIPIRSVGGVLEIFSALPPWGDRLPTSIDRAHLEEVALIVESMSRFSRDADVDIVFELDGESIGMIDAGVPDDSLTDVLLGEWRRVLAEREGGTA